VYDLTDQQLWGYKVEKELHLGVRELKRMHTSELLPYTWTKPSTANTVLHTGGLSMRRVEVQLYALLRFGTRGSFTSRPLYCYSYAVNGQWNPDSSAVQTAATNQQEIQDVSKRALQSYSKCYENVYTRHRVRSGIS
jgi:hypothetical protein